MIYYMHSFLPFTFCFQTQSFIVIKLFLNFFFLNLRLVSRFDLKSTYISPPRRVRWQAINFPIIKWSAPVMDISCIPVPLSIKINKAHVISLNSTHGFSVFHNLTGYIVLLLIGVCTKFNVCVAIIGLIFELESIYQLMPHSAIRQIIDVLMLMARYNRMPIVKCKLSISVWC